MDESALFQDRSQTGMAGGLARVFGTKKASRFREAFLII